jgi:phenylpropionate dioxygenase-like ring-hydroxylating dioxygenase large terminal subunit
MQLEKKLLQNFWHLIGHKNEFPCPGDFVKFETALGDIIIANDAGEIIAFDNKCIHRGSSLISSDYGNQSLSCKYHGWTYINGKTFIPNQGSFQQCSLENIYLNKYKLEWCGNFLFVSISPNSELKNQINEIYNILEKISYDIEDRLDFNRFDFNCYWPIAIENALEPYHIPFIHSKTLAKLKLEEGRNDLFALNSIWHAPIGDLRSKKLLDSMKKYFDLKCNFDNYMSIYIFPFSMLSSTYGFSYSMQNFFPSENIQIATKFSSRFYASRLNNSLESRKILGAFVESSIKINRQVFEEDSQICNTIPYDSWSLDNLNYQSNLEEKIKHFRGSCSKIMSVEI